MFAPITPMFALLALFAAATLATPAPRVHSFARDIPESIANATALGINVYGHIPDDAVKIGESSYSAEVGTLAHAWIRAQIDIDWTSETARDAAKMVKRELAHIGIGMWTQDWCNGNNVWHDDVQYGVHHISDLNMYSVGISYRGIRDNEHLDFSKFKGSDHCGQYVYSAGRLTPTGCFNSQAINCFRLWY